MAGMILVEAELRRLYVHELLGAKRFAELLTYINSMLA